MNAMIDINGLYMLDNTIFDDIILPSDINRSDLIDMIILECRELCLSIFSTSVMKRAIALWSKRNIYYWEELQKTMHYEYNAIENYNRSDKFSEKNTNNNENRQTGDNTSNEDFKVAAYNESDLTPRENRQTNNNNQLTIKDSGSGTIERTIYSSGNIGTMSTQDMINQQREIIDISLYNVIANSFKNEFCILKY